MRSIRVFCVTTIVIFLKISSAAQVGDPLEGKSAISTEYKARFHKIHQNGLNTSEGFIAGVHNMEKNTDHESWPSFAAKCAEVIKGIVAALTGAVTSEPGDRTDLHLDFKNRIYHHDNRKSNSTEENELAEPEDYVEPESIHNQNEFPDQYPYDSNADDPNHFSNHEDEVTGMKSPSEDEYRDNDVPNFHQGMEIPYQGSGSLDLHPDDPKPQLEILNDSDNSGVTEASTELTWNTPATQEAMYLPTEQVLEVLHQTNPHPTYPAPVRSEEEIDVTTSNPFHDYSPPEYQKTSDLLKIYPPGFIENTADLENPYRYSPTSPENLPLDNWKPSQNGQDFLPENPAGFGHPFSTPEIYTTPSPDYPKSSNPHVNMQHDQSLPNLTPESLNQMSQSSSVESSFDPYEYHEYPDTMEDDDDEDKSENGSSDVHHEEPSNQLHVRYQEESDTVQEETATTPPEIEQTVSEEIVQPDFLPPLPPGSNPLPPYGVSEGIFKILSSTTQTPTPSAIYIPITNYQTESITEGPSDPDEDCCCEEDTYDDESPNHKAICKTACRDLEEARNELKEIFDRIKKKLKCSRRLRY